MRARVRARCDRDGDRQWAVHVDPSDTWVHAQPLDTRLPTQGWKLHMSAGLSSADEVLRKALDVLVDAGVSFKVARSRAVLDALNWGFAGGSQIGKFMTVYPVDDAQAVKVAAALHEATIGERGPRIPSDRPLVAGSVVHYRYGSFATRYLRLATGEVVPAIEDPDGALVPDERRIAPPSWVDDPFIRAGAGARAPADPQRSAIGGRFVLTGTMLQTARGSVFLAVDLDGPRRCIVKHARRDSLLNARGADARDRLRAEAATLERLGADGPWPQLLALVDDGDDVYLAEDEVRGTTLAQLITTRIAAGRHLDPAVIVRWGVAIAEALDRIHGRGLIVRDLKAANIMVAPASPADDVEDSDRAEQPGGPDRTDRTDGEREVWLIDLECADAGASTADGTLGTRGSCSPAQRRGDAPTIADDIFSLGALLWFMATGADPAAAPDATALGDRQLGWLRPELGEPLVQVITTCLADDPHHRYRDTTEVARALATTRDLAERPSALPTSTAPSAPRVGTAAPTSPTSRVGERDPDLHAHRATADAPSTAVWARAARDIGAVLVERADRRGDDRVSWQPASGAPLTDLAGGDAGVVLALSALARVFPDAVPGLDEVIHAGARGLLRAPGYGGDPSPALFSGENGVALAILAAGTVLAEASLIDAAAACAETARRRAHGGFDLLDGSAGRARSMLWWHQATGDPRWLDGACVAGEHLVAHARPMTLEGGRGSGRYWTAGPPDRQVEPRLQPGYAGGAAGIADCLLQLYAATGDQIFCATACAALRAVVAAAVPALDGDHGITWPIAAGEPEVRIAWCHGTTGVATTLLRVRELGLETGAATELDLAALLPDAIDPAIGRDLDGLITAAATTVAAGTRAASSSQRDGLAGSLELLVDLSGSYHTAADRVAPAVADLADLLLAFVPSPDHPDRIAPASGYLDGLSGVLAVALRLAAPATPGLLGPQWWFAS